jgi:hypothetical protein
MCSIFNALDLCLENFHIHLRVNNFNFNFKVLRHAQVAIRFDAPGKSNWSLSMAAVDDSTSRSNFDEYSV